MTTTSRARAKKRRRGRCGKCGAYKYVKFLKRAPGVFRDAERWECKNVEKCAKRSPDYGL